MLISAIQIKAARVLLNWNQKNLAERAGVSKDTIANIETEKNVPQQDTFNKVIHAIEFAGIEFLDGDGVRRKNNIIQQLSGKEGLTTLMNDIYEVATTRGGEICLHNANPDNWLKWLDKKWYQERALKLSEFSDNFEMKCTVPEGNTNFIGGSYQKYRWLPKEMIVNENESVYIYGDKLGFIYFDDNNVDVLIQHSAQFAKSFRMFFRVAWDNVAKIPTCGEKGDNTNG